MELKSKDTREFFNAINNDLEKQISDIKSDADRYYAQTVKSAKNSAAKASRETIQQKTAELRRIAGREGAKCESKAKKDLFDKRNSIAQSVFKRTREKLKEFASSEEYADFLVSSVKAISKLIDSDDTVFFVKKEDLKYADLIRESYPGSCMVTEDESVKLGGIKAESGKLRLRADDTLDARLEENKSSFYETFDSYTTEGE